MLGLYVLYFPIKQIIRGLHHFFQYDYSFRAGIQFLIEYYGLLIADQILKYLKLSDATQQILD